MSTEEPTPVEGHYQVFWDVFSSFKVMDASIINSIDPERLHMV